MTQYHLLEYQNLTKEFQLLTLLENWLQKDGYSKEKIKEILPKAKIVYKILKDYGLPDGQIRIAFKIIKCESNWQERAKNTKGNDRSFGLWQLNLKAHSKWISLEETLNITTSTHKAMALYQKNGWRAWTCYYKINRNASKI